jgi:hypothetical protein
MHTAARQIDFGISVRIFLPIAIRVQAQQKEQFSANFFIPPLAAATWRFTARLHSSINLQCIT